MRLLAILAAVAALAAGCATVVVRDEPRRVDVAPGAEVDSVRIAEALLDSERGTCVQALEIEWKGKAFTAEAVVKGDGKSLTVVLLAPQMRLATLIVERPHRITWRREPRVPSSFPPEYALAEVAFVHLPAEVLSSALGAEFSVADDGRRRTVLHRGGEIRSLERREGGEMIFANKSAGYTCRILPAETMQ